MIALAEAEPGWGEVDIADPDGKHPLEVVHGRRVHELAHFDLVGQDTDGGGRTFEGKGGLDERDGRCRPVRMDDGDLDFASGPRFEAAPGLRRRLDTRQAEPGVLVAIGQSKQQLRRDQRRHLRRDVDRLLGTDDGHDTHAGAIGDHPR